MQDTGKARRTILITGANKGIGLALARAYKASGDHVIAVVRTTSDELAHLDVEVHENIDIANAASVAEIAKALSGRKIDILFNNAGVLISDNLIHLDEEAVRYQFEVNALGPLRLIRTLLPTLRTGSKIAIVSSLVGSLADNQRSGNYGYRMSKVAVNMAAKNLSIDLAPNGIGVYLFHPGFVKTDMVNHRGPTPPDVAATGMINVLERVTMAETGTFWHAEGRPLPW